MTITVTTPAALWLLAIVPTVWFGRWVTRTNFNSRQQMVQAAVRSLVLAALALAAARPVISMGSSALSVVYVVDVSHSISSRAIEDAAASIDRMQAEVRPSHSRIVAFGGDAVAIASTAELRELAKVDVKSETAVAVHRETSDIERALSEARAELAPGHVPRLILFSDARETAGDLRVAAARLSADAIPVFVQPMAVRELGDSWVDRIDVVRPVAPGALATVTVSVGSQRAVNGLVEVREGTTLLGSKAVALAQGTTVVPIDVSFEKAGAKVLDAKLTVPGDPLTVNNQLGSEVVVGSRPKVLYVEGSAGSAQYLERALTQSGFDVTVGTAAQLPEQQQALAPWDVVILSDLPRTAISDAAMTALGGWVERDGGGLLVAGGESVFGEGNPTGPKGYRNTELERLTPVTFERKDEPEVALIIVLDKSWSMAGQQMELCKAAAQAAIDVLADEQNVGLVTFNDEFQWEVTLRNVGKNRDMIRKAVTSIEPSGHTLIYPAIEQAFNALKEARARAKHVVLLSDGRSYPDDYEGLIKKMVEAKITVSSISVGAAADVELLTNIAKWGKGRSYVVDDAKEVPQIFVKEAKNATTPAFDEKAVKPVLKARGFLEGVDMAGAPSLRGRTATVLKDGALQLLATVDGDPLLAFWPVGLGRTAVFASDVKDRWASDWLKWRGYGPFFAATVRAVERRRAPAAAIELIPGPIRGTTRSVTMRVDARDEAGNYKLLPKLPVLQVRSASGKSADLTTHQTAPGTYEASVDVDATERLTVNLAGETSGATTRHLVPDEDSEYRLRPPDEGMLRAVATATGGEWQPTAAAIKQIAGASQVSRHAMWPWLVLAALLFWFLDVLVRRIRLFEGAFTAPVSSPAPSSRPQRA
jgi:uncharacterized membrane protein/uncharacterized protein YegL